MTQTILHVQVKVLSGAEAMREKLVLKSASNGVTGVHREKDQENYGNHKSCRIYQHLRGRCVQQGRGRRSTAEAALTATYR